MRSCGVLLLSGLVSLSGCASRSTGEPADIYVVQPPQPSATSGTPAKTASFRRYEQDVVSPLAEIGSADPAKPSTWNWLQSAVLGDDSELSEDAVLSADAARHDTGLRTTARPLENTPAVDPITTNVPTQGATAAIHSRASDSQFTSIDLVSALAAISGQTPAVGFAQWRVQQAYAAYDQARVMWLPTVQAGFSFHRHDGNYQASNGAIVDVNRNSFQYGLGNGATGAGTTPRPGLAASFHLADAVFQPGITQQRAWASQHAADAVINEQLLRAASSYLELLRAYQRQLLVEASNQRTEGLAKLTSDFAATGQGLQADADRMRTEAALAKTRLAEASEQIGIASASLAEALSLPYDRELIPTESTVVPIELVSLQLDRNDLISQALTSRPELHESQTLVAAACREHQQQRMRPFIPSVLLGFSTGEFGGGLGNDLDNLDGRYDFDAAMTWQARNLGWGDAAARRDARSRVQQTRYEAAGMMDRVARQVSEAHAQVTHRWERIEAARLAIDSAQQSYDRNLSRIRENQGLPLEVLQSIRALEDAQRTYLDAVTDYNLAQFRLQWALGWSITASAPTASAPTAPASAAPNPITAPAPINTEARATKARTTQAPFIAPAIAVN